MPRLTAIGFAPATRAPDGVRRVRMDNFLLCIDRLMFEKAWGQEIADQVVNFNSKGD